MNKNILNVILTLVILQKYLTSAYPIHVITTNYFINIIHWTVKDTIIAINSKIILANYSLKLYESGSKCSNSLFRLSNIITQEY